MKLLHIREAAQLLGVSYPTLKQWIYRKKIRTVQTAGGHHRVPQSEVDRILFRTASGATKPAPSGPHPAVRNSAGKPAGVTGLEQYISGRNQLVGRIVTLEIVGLLAKVKIDVGGQTVTAIITRDAARDLKLKAGEIAAALIKATEVMIVRPPELKS